MLSLQVLDSFAVLSQTSNKSINTVQSTLGFKLCNNCFVMQKRKERLTNWLKNTLQLWRVWPQNREWNICRRSKMPTASAKSSVMTKSSSQCRHMKWSVLNPLVFVYWKILLLFIVTMLEKGILRHTLLYLFVIVINYIPCKWKHIVVMV